MGYTKLLQFWLKIGSICKRKSQDYNKLCETMKKMCKELSRNT